MKWLRYAGVGALGVVALACAVLVLYNWHTARRSASLASAVRAKGQPMTVADLNRRLPLDNRNAARIYEDAFSMVGSPQLKGYARSICSAVADPVLTPERWDLIAADTDALTPLYDLLYQAAAMPECGFRQRETLGGLWFGGYVRALRCETLCGARATVAVRRGDRREAARMLRLLLAMGHSFGYEPCMGLYMQNMAVSCFTDAMQDAAKAGMLTPEMAETMRKGLDRLEPQRSYVRTLEGRRVGLGCRGAQAEVMDSSDNIIFDAWAKAIAPSQLAKLKEVVTSHLDHAGLSYRATQGRRGVHPWESIAGDGDSALRYAADDVASARRKRDELSALIAGDRAYLAILLYKMKRGSYPASLSDAAASAGWSLQPDPFSGKPFVYARKGTGFLLYSVGSNLMDDGGTSHSNGRVRPETDVVWMAPEDQAVLVKQNVDRMRAGCYNGMLR